MLLTAAQLITQTWRLYYKQWRALFPFMMLFFIPLLVMSVLGLLSLFLSATLPTSDFVNSLFLVALFFLSILFSVLASIALSRAVKDLAVSGTTLPWKAHLHASVPLLKSVIFASALTILVIIGGTLLFIVPGIIFTVWFMFTSYAVMFEGFRGRAALAESKRLVDGRFWSVAWRISLPLMVFSLATSFTAYLAGVPLFFLGTYQVTASSGFSMVNILAQFGGSLLTSFLNSIFTPLTIIPIILLYLDLRANPPLPVLKHLHNAAPPAPIES